jgi:hypothetical protein
MKITLTPIDQNVEYYHVHHCVCGAEVFHDGAAATCEDAYFETFQCASCKPYPYEELLVRGEVLPVKPHNLLETVCITAIGWICGLISCGAIWLVFR